MSKQITLAKKAEEIRAQVVVFCREHGIRHLASSLSCVGILVELFYQVVRDVDVVVLSKGHASPAWWCIYRDLVPQEAFRPGDELMATHLPLGVAGMRVTAGSLGHGLGIGAGMALGMPWRRVYVVLGDAELCEGSVWEAVMFASARGLGNLIAIVDWNQVGATGWTHNMGVDCIWDRFKAFGWRPVGSVTDLPKCTAKNTPRFVVVSTTKGEGVPELERDPVGCHGRLS